MNIHLTLEVSTEAIMNICNVAFEGGIDHWCSNILLDTIPVKFKGEVDFIEEVIALGGSIKLTDKESEETYILTPDNFNSGLQLYLDENYTDLDIPFDLDNLDADMADQIIQYALFGEMVFS